MAVCVTQSQLNMEEVTLAWFRGEIYLALFIFSLKVTPQTTDKLSQEREDWIELGFVNSAQNKTFFQCAKVVEGSTISYCSLWACGIHIIDVLYIIILLNIYVGWLVGFYGISTFVGYLTPNLFLYR